MNKIFTKNIELQDARYKLVPNNNNETSIFIPKDNGEAIGLEHDKQFTFYLDKENILYILFNTFNFALKQPLYEKSVAGKIEYRKVIEQIDILKSLPDIFPYTVKVSVNGNRFYLKELRQPDRFNLRDILIGSLYALNFYKESDDSIHCRIELKDKDPETSQQGKVILEDKYLRSIIFRSFKYLLENYDERIVLENPEFKASKIEDRSFTGIALPEYFGFENLLAQFDSDQMSSDLKSSGTMRFIDEVLKLSDGKFTYFTTQWNEGGDRGLSLKNFNRYLSAVSAGTLQIISQDNIFRLVLLQREQLFGYSNVQEDGYNKIYFGPPGTGKSHAIKEELKKLGVKQENYSRVTFHPDYDYHSFVGGYKPVNEGDVIKYKFVPQVFTDLYLKAWNNQNENYYLVIEEINRGNCAEIFGDIFQLLDRNPEYNIEPSTELREYFEEVNQKRKSAGEDEISLLFDGKLQMPDNLSILASMNTSDQSLYPMDSAFKRRWDWHYIPIDLNCHDSDFIIEIDDSHKYSWLDFLSKVNDKIYSVTKSEDKQIGNWFINAAKSANIISKELFINKVLFYLWNDIFKDEVFNPDNVFIERDDKGIKVRDISFNNFYNKKEQEYLLNHLLEDILGLEVLKNKEVKSYMQDDDLISNAAEEIGNVLNNDTDTE